MPNVEKAAPDDSGGVAMGYTTIRTHMRQGSEVSEHSHQVAVRNVADMLLSADCDIIEVPPARLERATNGVADRRSFQLSYGGMTYMRRAFSGIGWTRRFFFLAFEVRLRNEFEDISCNSCEVGGTRQNGSNNRKGLLNPQVKTLAGQPLQHVLNLNQHRFPVPWRVFALLSLPNIVGGLNNLSGAGRRVNLLERWVRIRFGVNSLADVLKVSPERHDGRRLVIQPFTLSLYFQQQFHPKVIGSLISLFRESVQHLFHKVTHATTSVQPMMCSSALMHYYTITVAVRPGQAIT